jgi:hypothetical protein
MTFKDASWMNEELNILADATDAIPEHTLQTGGGQHKTRSHPCVC